MAWDGDGVEEGGGLEECAGDCCGVGHGGERARRIVGLLGEGGE